MIADKYGLSFSDNFWKLTGIGFVVNVVIALVLDIEFSALFFLTPFVFYAQFYLSGKMYIKSLQMPK